MHCGIREIGLFIRQGIHQICTHAQDVDKYMVGFSYFIDVSYPTTITPTPTDTTMRIKSVSELEKQNIYLKGHGIVYTRHKTFRDCRASTRRGLTACQPHWCDILCMFCSCMECQRGQNPIIRDIHN